MDAVDAVALVGLAAPRLCRIGLLSPVSDDSDPEDDPHWGVIRGAGKSSAELAITALAMGLPRPVDAAGRPAALQIIVGCHLCRQPWYGSTEEGVRSVLAAAGRGWVTVEWPTIDGSADGDSTGSGGSG
jgi:hypothetical protein